MDLSGPVVVQRYSYLPICPIWACPCSYATSWSFDLDPGFSRSNLEMLYIRRTDWHGTKGMWVDWMLDPWCTFQLWSQPWHWPCILDVKFWNNWIPGMGGPIEMERKGYESIGCYTYFVTLSYDLDLGFSRLNFKNAVSHEGGGGGGGDRHGTGLNIFISPQLGLSCTTIIPSCGVTIAYMHHNTNNMGSIGTCTDSVSDNNISLICLSRGTSRVI